MSPPGDGPGSSPGVVSRETNPPPPPATDRQQPPPAATGTRQRRVSRETSEPARWVPLTRWLGLAVITGLAWLPCWWDLQRVGGYGPVAANHRTYLVGSSQWLATAWQQWQVLQWLDGQLGLLLPALALGLVAVACLSTRWGPGTRSSGWVLILFLSGSAIAGVGASSVLLSGLWLVDLLRPAHRQVRARYESWLLAAWLVGVSLSLWQYRPFPRLTVPWLIATALASGAWFAKSLLPGPDSLASLAPAPASDLPGVAPGIQPGASGVSPETSPSRSESGECQSIAAGGSPAVHWNHTRLAFGAGLLWLVGVGPWLLSLEGQPPRSWFPATPVDQRGVASAAAEVVESIRRHQGLPSGKPLDNILIYVQGEPAVLHHLRRLGVPECRPVQDLSFARQPGPTVAAVYVVSGERSWRLPGNQEDRQQARYLQPLARVPVALPPLAWFDEPPLRESHPPQAAGPFRDSRLRWSELQIDFHGREVFDNARPR